MTLKPFVNRMMTLVVVFSVIATAILSPSLGQAVTGNPGTTSVSATEDISAPQTPNLPPTMPVFALQPTLVNHDIILGNASRLNGVEATEVFSETSPTGLQHFFALNPNSGNMVEQFNQTGGFFAVNFSRAYSETELLTDPTNTTVCSFLLARELFPSEIDPQYTNCQGNPPYTVKYIHLSTLTPGTGQGTNTIIGKLVQVPLAINIGAAAPNYIPLSGPGGHLSLLLAGNPDTSSLDGRLPGLQALASPWFGHRRSPNPIGYYPVVSRQEAIRRFKARFPAEMQVDAGTPQMVYYVGFPDAPQDALMPTWTFPDATAVISGTVVELKETTEPGVDGFAPTVNIQTPVDGTVFMPSEPVTITFSVAGDQGPFTYTISADENVLTTGVMVSGTLTLGLGPLPLASGRTQGRSLSVRAVNRYNTPGEAIVFLGALQNLYLPLAARNSTPTLRQAAFTAGLPATPRSPASQLRIGVEWVMNYHDPSSNLSQTKPDAEGLYNWMPVAGWGKTFNYGNDSAWEKDWRDCSLGGIDCGIGVDRVDFAYFSGHGSPSSWYFGVAKDYGGAWAGNARFQKIRWAAFSSCKTVRGGPYVGSGNPPLTEWFNSFQGSYMVLGFHSVMADIPFGFTLGFNLYNPLYSVFPSMQPSIREAWVNTAFAMNAGKPSYLYAVGNFNPVNYRLPMGSSGPLPALTGIYEYRWVWWDD